MSQEKIFHLRALGAEVRHDPLRRRQGPSRVLPGHGRSGWRARRPARFYVNQFGNPANPQAHERTTGPEIWRADGRPSWTRSSAASAAAAPSRGLSRYFARVAPQVEMVLADPAGSVLARIHRDRPAGRGGLLAGRRHRRGLHPARSPISPACGRPTRSRTPKALRPRATLLRQEGILAGSSSGTLVAAALRYCREQTAPERVVTFVCDSGNKYLSKMFNDYWMIDQGFLRARAARRSARPDRAAPRARVSDRRRARGHAADRVRPHASSTTSRSCRCSRAIASSASSTSPICCSRSTHDDGAFRGPVSAHMSSRLETVRRDARSTSWCRCSNTIMSPSCVEGERFLGLITRIDLLNYLRRGCIKP